MNLPHWLIPYDPLLKALVKLFHPLVEVAAHDLKSQTIVALYHNFSKRQEGDASPLSTLKVDPSQIVGYTEPYKKCNWNGRVLKCTTVCIRDSQNQPVGIICINFDTSFFEKGCALFNTLLKTEPHSQTPVEQLGEKASQAIHNIIEHFLDHSQTTLDYLTRKEKKNLVEELYHKGAFNYRNAPSLIAKTLKLSRATVYKYLQQIGESSG